MSRQDVFGVHIDLVSAPMVNINILVGLSRDLAGVRELFIGFFRPIFLWGRGKHIKKIARRSQDNPVYAYVFCSVFVSLPTSSLLV